MRFTYKTDNALMDKLNVQEIRHYICQTNKGDLTLMLRKGETEYKVVLDSVPVSEEVSKEVMDIVYPKYEVPQVKVTSEMIESGAIVKIKQSGRPKKVK